MIRKLSFANPNRGRQPRANAVLRFARVLRRKRVAWDRAQVWDTYKLLQRQIARMEAAAKRHDVPLDAMSPLPPIPLLPGDDWVQFLRAQGELRPVVKPAPQAIQATA
jgi:hypothetical protein